MESAVLFVVQLSYVDWNLLSLSFLNRQNELLFNPGSGKKCVGLYL